MADGEGRPPDERGSRRLTRRSVLALSSGISAVLAGCSALEPDTGPPPTTSPPDDDPDEPPTETPLEEFGNNGIYASRCDGAVEVIGGVYRNNNV